MGILCIDVGRGTRDILFYEKGKKMENCPSLILPSWSSLVEAELRASLEEGKTPVLFGVNMGGFSLQKYRLPDREILATAEAARTFHDDPARWEGLGLRIVDEVDSLKGNNRYRFIETRDTDPDALCRGLAQMGFRAEIEGVAVAVQDHGEAPPGVSNRKFRFQRYREMLPAGLRPMDYSWRPEDLPPYLTRMRAVAQSLRGRKNVLLMDTGMAAVAGALDDPLVRGAGEKIVVNIGNSHTLAAYLHQAAVVGVVEHHTGLLDREKISGMIEELADGTVDGDRVFQQGGHGALCLDHSFRGVENLDLICVTGPRRDLLSPMNYHFAAPYGNMMLTGSYGILNAYRKFYG